MKEYLNALKTEGEVEIGKFYELSESQSKVILDLLKSHQGYLIIDTDTATYNICRETKAFKDTEYLVLMNDVGVSRGEIREWDKDISNLNNVVFRCVKPVFDKRYGNKSDYMLDLFKKVINKPLTESQYFSPNKVRNTGMNISELIDEFLICYGTARNALFDHPKKSYQIVYSFLLGLCVNEDGHFVLKLFKDYYLETNKQQHEEAVRVNQEERRKEDEARSENFHYYATTQEGAEELCQKLSDKGICYMTTDYEYGYRNISELPEVVSVHSLGKEYFSRGYIEHYMTEGDNMELLNALLKRIKLTKKNAGRLFGLSHEIARATGHSTYLTIDQKGYVDILLTT